MKKKLRQERRFDYESPCKTLQNESERLMTLIYVILTLPVGQNSLETLYDNIDEEIEKLKTELISDREYEKLQNEFENNFVSTNSSISGIANSLASYYLLHDNVNLINERLDIYKSITKEEIKDVANKYLNKNSRAVIDYLPESSKQ